MTPAPEVRLVGLLARVLPDRGMRREAVRAFESGYGRRRTEEGRWRALLYALRTGLDLARTGVGERLRTRGGRWGGRGRGVSGQTTTGTTGTTGETTTTARTTTRRWGMNGLTWEMRYALRVLRRSPGFALAVIVILALGIGGNTAVFSALEAVVLAPPPYPEPERLVFPKILRVQPGQTDTTTMTWSHAKYRMVEDQSGGSFEGVAAYADRIVTLRERGDPERIGIELVTPDYFRLLGVDAALGRTFTPEEDGSEPSGVALLSHELWTTRFGSDPGAVGARLVLDDAAFTVVGVLPAGFDGLLGGAEAWVPLGDARTLFHPSFLDEPGAHWLHAVARLGPGVAPERARTRLADVGRELEATWPLADEGGWAGAGFLTMAEARDNRAARASVLVLGAGAVLVLLIAVMNLAGLFLARELERRRESSVRLALGSGWWGLLRGRVVEAGVLVVVGGLLGLGLARLGIDGIVAAWPAEFSRGADDGLRALDVAGLGLNRTVLLFSALITAGTGLLFAVVPALAHRRLELVTGLKEGAGATARGWGRGGSRRLLVAGQAALAVVLLVASGLLGSSLLRLQAVDPGFDDERLLTVGLSGVGQGEAVAGAWETLLERIEALPAVRGATVATAAPYSGVSMSSDVSRVEGGPPLEPAERPRGSLIQVAEDYFEVLGARVVRGGGFQPSSEGGPESVIVNQSAARAFFGDRDPVGRTFDMGIRLDGSGGRYRVDGVVEDILTRAPDAEPVAMIYAAMAGRVSRGSLLIRTDGEPFDVLPAVREVVRSLHPDVPMTGITTVEDLAAGTVGDTRVLASLLGLFAALALTLTATGIYGVVAFGVTRRRRELGLRMALGARSGQVAGRVLGEGVATAALGVVAGVGVALLGAPLLSGLLFEVGERDPIAFTVGAVALLAAAALASWIPARRVTRLDPADVLRAE